MSARVPREEDNAGRVLVTAASTDTRAVRVPLGRGRGVLSIRVTAEGKTNNAAQLYIRWEGRPGDPVSVADRGWATDKDYLTHALLDLETGEMYPGYQGGDPVTDEILHSNLYTRKRTRAQAAEQAARVDTKEIGS